MRRNRAEKRDVIPDPRYNSAVLALAPPPTDQVFRLNLARIYLQAGNTAAARPELPPPAKLGATFRTHLEVRRLLKTL